MLATPGTDQPMSSSFDVDQLRFLSLIASQIMWFAAFPKYQNNQRCILTDMFKSIFEWCADENSRDTMLKSVSI